MFGQDERGGIDELVRACCTDVGWISHLSELNPSGWYLGINPISIFPDDSTPKLRALVEMLYKRVDMRFPRAGLRALSKSS